MSEPLPLLPTTVVGSHALPGWFYWALEGVRQEQFGRLEIRELFDDAVDLAILDQERAGVDVIWDGEMRRSQFIMGYFAHLTGVRSGEVPRKQGPFFYDQAPLQEIVERIAAPNGLGIVDEYRYLRRRTAKRLKAPVAGALTLLTPTVIKGGYQDEDTLLADLVAIVNRECRDLVAAGCDFIQIDEPAFHRWFREDPRRVVEVFNRTVAGVEAKIALHICFGNLAGRPRTLRTHAPFLKHMGDLRAEQFVLEFANREMAELDLWRDTLPERELAAGVVDQKSFYRETPEDVAGRIRQVLAYVPPEKLWLTSDCGFFETPRWLTRQKLSALVEGTRLVRAELSS